MCSIGLAALVVVNAQFGCDSPSATAPEDNKPAPEPETKTDAEPVAAPSPDPRADANATANPEPEPEINDDPDPEPTKPTLMPASKSAGDFGDMRFPGEAAPTQQQQQAPNPAPNQAK